ncbi:hypothetical protein L596_026673 [Steinernema carpocapsae]|uniref:7TM GPCR serpentine receptor class x (Srx) domain-containing protein n=1 Tax=Steinernema carpocapsae TaxID=34508 RepID=A0A4V5ZY95_STECR|nr:hypothetical protein L596_026673 [Steinernema carpocapsae]
MLSVSKTQVVGFRKLLNMDVYLLTASIICISMIAFCSPILMRIAYIFYTKNDFRELHCYRLMGHLVTSYSLFGPVMFVVLSAFLLDTDLLGFLATVHLFGQFIWCFTILMTCLLAIDRLITVCQLPVNGSVLDVLSIVGLIIDVCRFVFLLSPYAGVQLDLSKITIVFDESKSYSITMQYLTFCVNTAVNLTTLLTYFVLFLYLLCKKVHFGLSSINGQQKRFLIKAVLIFLSQVSVDLLYCIIRPLILGLDWQLALFILWEMVSVTFAPLCAIFAFTKSVEIYR